MKALEGRYPGTLPADKVTFDVPIIPVQARYEIRRLVDRAVREYGEGHIGAQCYVTQHTRIARVEGATRVKGTLVGGEVILKPACLLGVILDYKGVDLEHLWRHNSIGVSTLMETGFFPKEWTDEIHLLLYLQEENDHGATWGSIREQAPRY